MVDLAEKLIVALFWLVFIIVIFILVAALVGIAVCVTIGFWIYTAVSTCVTAIDNLLFPNSIRVMERKLIDRLMHDSLVDMYNSK